MLDEPLYSERAMYKIKGKEYKPSIRGIKRIAREKLLNCHFCANTWDSSGNHFICPKCHTVFNPRLGGAGFGGEVKVARYRAGISQPQLMKIVGCGMMALRTIENNEPKAVNAEGKMLRERLRVWIESTKSPLDRRKEIDDMFNDKEK